MLTIIKTKTKNKDEAQFLEILKRCEKHASCQIVHI